MSESLWHSTAQHQPSGPVRTGLSRPCERFLTRNGIHLPWHCPVLGPCRMPCHVVMLCLGIASTSDVDERRDEAWLNQVQGATTIEH